MLAGVRCGKLPHTHPHKSRGLTFEIFVVLFYGGGGIDWAVYVLRYIFYTRTTLCYVVGTIYPILTVPIPL